MIDERPSRVSGGVVVVDLVGADHVDHARALAEVDRLRCAVDAAQIEVVASAIEGALHLDDGHRSTSSWVVATLDVAKWTGVQWSRRGELAVRFPAFLDAFRDGRLHLDHYDLIAKACANPRAWRLLGDVVDDFIAAAASLTFPEYERMIAVWVQLADQDGRQPDDRIPTRNLKVRNRADGSCALNGFFDPEAAATIREILGRFLDEENRIDRETAAEVAAAGGSDELPRTLGERTADALVAALAQTVTRQPGQPAKPLTRLVVSWQVAQQLLTGVDAGNPVDVRDLLCRQMNGDPIDVRAALAALIEGRVKVLVVDALGRPYAASRQGTLFDEQERQDLQALHPDCEWPGCPVHAPRLQADHMQPRSRGGPTSMDNAAALCGRHNRWRHTHGYHVTRDPDGRLQTYRPDGTPLRPTA